MTVFEKIEAQQKGRGNTDVWMVGEQLKDICRADPACATIVAEDLENKAMSIEFAARKNQRIRRRSGTPANRLLKIGIDIGRQQIVDMLCFVLNDKEIMKKDVFGSKRLLKFRNGAQRGEDGKIIRGTGKMVFNWFPWERDGKEYPKIHPTQKPVGVLKRLIEIFTDPGDVVIDPCADSGSTLRAAWECGRSAYGFERSKEFYTEAVAKMLPHGEGEHED